MASRESNERSLKQGAVAARRRSVLRELALLCANPTESKIEFFVEAQGHRLIYWAAMLGVKAHANHPISLRDLVDERVGIAEDDPEEFYLPTNADLVAGSVINRLGPFVRCRSFDDVDDLYVNAPLVCELLGVDLKTLEAMAAAEIPETDLGGGPAA